MGFEISYTNSGRTLFTFLGLLDFWGDTYYPCEGIVDFKGTIGVTAWRYEASTGVMTLGRWKYRRLGWASWRGSPNASTNTNTHGITNATNSITNTTSATNNTTSGFLSG